MTVIALPEAQGVAPVDRWMTTADGRTALNKIPIVTRGELASSIIKSKKESLAENLYVSASHLASELYAHSVLDSETRNQVMSPGTISGGAKAIIILDALEQSLLQKRSDKAFHELVSYFAKEPALHGMGRQLNLAFYHGLEMKQDELGFQTVKLQVCRQIT